MTPVDTDRDLLVDTGLETLDCFRSRKANIDGGADAGPVVLAACLAASGDPDTQRYSTLAVQHWLAALRPGESGPGLWGGGLAGMTLGAAAATRVQPEFGVLASAFRRGLLTLPAATWRLAQPRWLDYDLISGPAGVQAVLAATGDPGDCRRNGAVDHLLAACADLGLPGLRLGDCQGDDRLTWGLDRVNLGMAHGAAGVAVALRYAAGSADPGDTQHQTLRRLCCWLTRQSFVDLRGMVTWPPASETAVSGHPSRRQAWCYGTPGMAWALWSSAIALDDADLQSFAVDAMRSFCRVFDPNFHLDNSTVSAALGICHGAAGVLAVADAFHRHAGLPEAGALAEFLHAHVVDRLPQVRALADDDLTLLTGASGIVAALLTRCSPTNRFWLRAIGLA